MTNKEIVERLREILQELDTVQEDITSCVSMEDTIMRIIQEDLDGSALEGLRSLILELEIGLERIK